MDRNTRPSIFDDMDIFPSPPSSQPTTPSLKPSMSDTASIRSRSSMSIDHPLEMGSCAGLSDEACRELWECMLELQLRYGCYKSARMQAAVVFYDREDGPDLMPSRACLDLLNTNIEDLPEEGWRILGRHISVSGERERRRRWSWRWFGLRRS